MIHPLFREKNYFWKMKRVYFFGNVTDIFLISEINNY